MSDETKTYRVKTVFEIQDKASSELKGIEKASKETASAVGELKELAKRFLEFKIVEKALEGFKEALFDVNVELQAHQATLAGLTSIYTGASLERSWTKAGDALSRFTDFSWESGIATEKSMAIAEQLQGPLLQAGMSFRQINTMVENTGLAAEAFGKTSEDMAAGLQRSIMIGVSSRNLEMVAMLQQAGYSTDKFNKMDSTHRAATLSQILGSPKIREAAEFKSQNTFEGVYGRVKSHLGELARIAAQPLFERLTEELKNAEQWMVKNRKELESIAKTIGDKVVKGFELMKDVFVWIYEHRDILLLIAKTYAAIKIGGLLGGALGEGLGKLGGIGGMFEHLNTPLSKLGAEGEHAAGMMGKVAAAAGPLIAAFAGGYVIGDAIHGVIKKQQEKEKKAINDGGWKMDMLLDPTLNANAKAHLGAAMLREGYVYKGHFTPGNQVDWEKIAYASGNAENYLKYKMAKDVGFGTMSITRGGQTYNVKGDDLTYQMMASQKELVLADRALAAAQEGWKYELQYSIDTFRQGIANALFIKSQTIIQDMLDKLQYHAKPAEQTVNVTIQQMTAKDPNRWLADLDDVVARRTRARTRAKKAWKVSPK